LFGNFHFFIFAIFGLRGAGVNGAASCDAAGPQAVTQRARFRFEWHLSDLKLGSLDLKLGSLGKNTFLVFSIWGFAGRVSTGVGTRGGAVGVVALLTGIRLGNLICGPILTGESGAGGLAGGK
jgi:hypothetical protein